MVTQTPGPGEALLYFAEEMVIDGCAYEAGKPGVVAGAEAYRLEQGGIAFKTAGEMKEAIKARKAQAQQNAEQEEAEAQRAQRREDLNATLSELEPAQLVELAQAEGIEGAAELEPGLLIERLIEAELAKDEGGKE